MELLNTRKFNDIVKFYDLEKEILYYKLYNSSKYKNSYHGWEHVKRVICSIFELVKEKDWSHKIPKNLMTAAIFHDFNYVEISENPNYDSININSAVAGYNRYLQNCRTYPDFDIDVVRNLIFCSEYPACMKMDLSNIEKVFVECDHSMVIHEGYEYMAFLFNLNEGRLSDADKIKENLMTYLTKIKYSEPLFQAIWEDNKDDIIKNCQNFINIRGTNNSTYNYIRRNYDQPDYELNRDYHFEVI